MGLVVRKVATFDQESCETSSLMPAEALKPKRRSPQVRLKRRHIITGAHRATQRDTTSPRFVESTQRRTNMATLSLPHNRQWTTRSDYSISITLYCEI